MKRHIALVLAALGFALVPVACSDDIEATPAEPLIPPDGTGGFNPGDGGGQSGSGAYGAGASGGSENDGGVGGTGGDSGPPACAEEYRRCPHEFTYAAGTETSVEVRGSFSENGWDVGIPMTKSGSVWTATVDIPWDFAVHYKFVLDGTQWVADPSNPTTVPDGQGGVKSVLAGETCATWTCDQDPAPGACAEAERTCDFKFVYPYTNETSVQVRGDFAPDGWTVGLPLAKQGAQWVGVVPDLAWGADIQYKFVINGTDWITDPYNINTTPDGVGGFNSLIQSLSCEWWSCDGSTNPDAFDWRDAVMYFVFVDRFNDGNPANNGSATGSGVLTPADWQGGDWAGVLEKVEDGYFTDLGVNTLWISAPMDNTSAAGVGVGGDSHMYSAYHGYWPSVLDKTEEHFGTMAELTALVDAAHAKGIKVIVDYVMNHVHESSPVYQQNPTWFWTGNDKCVCGQTCGWDGAEGRRCWFTDYLPDFNFTNAAARNFSVGNAISWIQLTGIDGFRLDAVKHIEDQWIIDLRARVKSEIEPASQEHFYMVGETFTGDRNTIKHYVGPSMLDGQFEFPLRLKLLSTLLTRSESMANLDSELGVYESFYGSSSVMSTFVGNHDVPRPIHFAQDIPISDDGWYDGKNRAWSNQPGLPGEISAFERLANAFTVLFTIKGIPLVYYGDEVGLPGAGDPDNRRFMQWNNYSAGQTKLRNHLKALTKIRADHPALRRGSRSSIAVTNDTYAYRMQTSGDTVYVIINRGDSQQQVSGLPSGTLQNALTGTSVTGPSISVPARTSMILVP